MFAGDPTAWAGRFRSFDVRFVERIGAVWQRCVDRLPEHPHEDTITANLVDLLNEDPEVRRRFYWIEFQYVPFGYKAEGTAYSTGSVDIAVLLNQDRDIYLAYECKRLNDVRKDGRRSLAGDYVTDGLSRFVAEQYSEGLPLACMLGYVLDGDVEYAESNVRAKIAELHGAVGLVTEPQDAVPIGESRRFFSRHRRQSGDEIEVRHALFPVEPGTPGSSASCGAWPQEAQPDVAERRRSHAPRCFSKRVAALERRCAEMERRDRPGSARPDRRLRKPDADAAVCRLSAAQAEVKPERFRLRPDSTAPAVP